MGSEMCIRDRSIGVAQAARKKGQDTHYKKAQSGAARQKRTRPSKLGFEFLKKNPECKHKPNHNELGEKSAGKSSVLWQEDRFLSR